MRKVNDSKLAIKLHLVVVIDLIMDHISLNYLWVRQVSFWFSGPARLSPIWSASPPAAGRCQAVSRIYSSFSPLPLPFGGGCPGRVGWMHPTWTRRSSTSFWPTRTGTAAPGTGRTPLPLWGRSVLTAGSILLPRPGSCRGDRLWLLFLSSSPSQESLLFCKLLPGILVLIRKIILLL